ncbi:Tn3 family transposase [Frankia sp. R82]|uniref:Tn3 family transposase n=1 Tax=Frankia sp. R82 TaxID=2950553 RepID=UPI002043EF14|nr:Tn3 family transposase [Frankia sp. R82]MCM3884816.1 Tn3 family transposase [Frankia sp. R82]
MASIERTAYPRFKRTISSRELCEAFTASPAEIEWAVERTTTAQHRLALLVLLKCYQRLGYFPSLAAVPADVVGYVRGQLELEGSVAAEHDAPRTAKWHRGLVRERLGVVYEPAKVRAVAEAALRDAAQGKDNPADLINAALVDAGYPANADLVIDETSGMPMLKARRGRRPSARVLEEEIHARLPQRALLDILTRTAHLLGWHRHFGPASGSDPKLADPLARYALMTFTYGANLGPAQVARHMRGQVSAHELSTAANKHVTAGKLDQASADVTNAYVQLDLSRAYGDGSTAGTDGSQIDTWENNLLAETSVRYGGYGGIAFRHISDTYIALFSRFIPCGVWEAVYIIRRTGCGARQTSRPLEVVVLAAVPPDGTALSNAIARRRQAGHAVVVRDSETLPLAARTALHSGARGYLCAGDGPTELSHAVTMVTSGGFWLSGGARRGPLAFPGNALGPRQLEAVTLYAAGLTRAEIAHTMTISPGMVNNYLSDAQQRIGQDLTRLRLGRHAWATLSPREIEVFELHRCGLSRRQIALRIGIRPDTVKEHLAAGRRKLRKAGMYSSSASPTG